MVEYNPAPAQTEQELDLVFHALADGTRRRLLSKMLKRPRRVTSLAEEFDCSLNAISKHLKVLERAQLISRSVEGRVHLCSPNPKEMQKAKQWIATYQAFWGDRLNQLDKFLKKQKDKGEPK